MRTFIYTLMMDKRKGAIYAPIKFALYLVSLLYGAAIFFRKVFYDVGFFKKESVPMKVISVGNLTLGGTGKTPFVIKLTKLLSQEMKKEVSVLIRGYGWDEAAMLKANLPDHPVLVDENRVKSAHKAIKLYGCNTAVLDDGFQYWELKRDLDIVLISSRNPFGNGKLFPRGILREPVDSIKRADVVIFTKVDKKLYDISALKDELRKVNPKLLFLEASHKPKQMHEIKTKKVHDLAEIKGKKLILLSSIGDPKYFKEMAKGMGATVVAHLIFQDHYDYTKKDIDNITK
ncbi:MAG: tetraacyldisaccharide 4'-kinase, partial [Candidatus Omnitrophota bacterium]